MHTIFLNSSIYENYGQKIFCFFKNTLAKGMKIIYNNSKCEIFVGADEIL